MLFDKQVNSFFGLELRTWAVEGLIDILAPDFSLQTRDHDDSNPDNIDMNYFRKVVAGTDCQLFPRLPHYERPDKYIEYFQRMLNYGVNGMYLWDAIGNYFEKPEKWAYVRNFGKTNFKDDIRLPKRILLKSLGGFVTDKYPAHSAF